MVQCISRLGEVTPGDILERIMSMYGVEKKEQCGARDLMRHDWMDKLHEEPGGCDTVGCRPPSGLELYLDMFGVLIETGGLAAAWGDVSGNKLNPE